MKNTQDIYNERLNRLKAAIELKKPDRVPVIAWSDAFTANHMGVKLSEFSTNPELASDTMVNSFKELSTFDASERPTTNPRFLAAGFLCKIKLAGKELPEGSIWQLDEQERVKAEDYDKIVKDGWGKFVSGIELSMLNFLPEDRAKAMAAIGNGIKQFNEAGIVVFAPATAAIPTEPLAAGRTMARFMTDLFEISGQSAGCL